MNENFYFNHKDTKSADSTKKKKNFWKSYQTIIASVITGIVAIIVPIITIWGGDSKIPGQPQGSSGVPPGRYRIDKEIVNEGSYLVKLDDIVVTADGEFTVNIIYLDTTADQLNFGCNGYSDPTIDQLSADGQTFQAIRTYCSDNPQQLFTLEPGGTHQSYAVFDNLTGISGPFSLIWQNSELDDIVLH
jgi:hypothetical protein